MALEFMSFGPCPCGRICWVLTSGLVGFGFMSLVSGFGIGMTDFGVMWLVACW